MDSFGPKATPIVAVIGFVLDIAIAIFFFVNMPIINFTTILFILPFLVIAFCYLMVVFGHIYRNCSLFLPFLALKPLGLIVGVLLCITSVPSIIMINMEKNKLEKDPSRKSPYLTVLVDREPYVIIFMIVMGITTALHAWFYSIIFRAYVLVKEKSAPDNANSEGYGDVAAGPTCCCGPFRARIETGITVIALIGFFFQLSAAVMSFSFYNLCFWFGLEHCFVALLFGLLFLASAIAYLVVVFAQRERNPSLFLPFLFIMPIAKAASVSFWIFLFFYLIKLFNKIPSDKVGPLIPLLFFFVLPLLFLFSITLFHTWFYSLIFRAFKKTKQQKSASFITNSSSRAEESRVGP
ncbi:hypothetical protein niasHS_001459 [Heterodera schachtii]|uniref:Uncharacterized protein n=1 Tax=Heterodera schachtii TaxID=97005 RepID=A0ABD2KE21_HETSC